MFCFFVPFFRLINSKMKKIILSTVLLCGAVSATKVQALPELKIAFVRKQYIIELMPEYEKAIADFTAFVKALESEKNTKLKGIQERAAALGKDPNNMTEAQKAEFQNLVQEVQKIDADYENRLRIKQESLVRPLQTKVSRAIEDVRKEKGISVVFLGETIEAADQSLDVSNEVLKKMGIDPVAAKKKKDVAEAAAKAQAVKK